MAGLLYFFVYIILPIAVLLVGAYCFYYHKRVIAAKLLTAAALAIPFLIISFIVLFVTFWESGMRRPERPGSGDFLVVNKSSTPLRVSACFSFTPYELHKLMLDGLEINPEINYLSYRDVFLADSSGTSGAPYFYFRTPVTILWEHCPSGLYISIGDTSGNTLMCINSLNIDSAMCVTMHLEITDSLLQLSGPGMTKPQNRQEMDAEEPEILKPIYHQPENDQSEASKPVHLPEKQQKGGDE